MKVPIQQPEPGFYYHFKHEQKEGSAHHAYEVFGPCRHTETGEWSVMYRPMYELIADGVVVKICNRPLEMFLEEAQDEKGNTVPRFTKITDPKVIIGLRKVGSHLYPSVG